MKSISLLITQTLIYSSLLASDFYHASSFQGYSGIINTPNAEVMHEGSADLLYSNEVDSTNIKKSEYLSKNYLVNIGLFSFAEVNGRLAEQCKKSNHLSCNFRDLSGSAKLQIPYYNKWLPKVALGVQDIGSAAAHYESKYIVASKQLYFLNASLGYATDSTRMDGIFGGVEVRTFDWLYLLGEYDTNEYAAALRFVTPSKLSRFVNLSFTAKKTINSDKNEEYYFMGGIQFHLGADDATSDTLKENNRKELTNRSDIDFQSREKSLKKEFSKPLPTLKLPKQSSPEKLKKILVNAGFENVMVGSKDKELFVSYENNMYNTNELDAIGVILGYMAPLANQYDTFTLQMQKSAQPLRALHGNLKLCQTFYTTPSPLNAQTFVKSLHFTAPVQPENFSLISGNTNSSLFKTRIELSPGVKSFVGTEYGNFDYLISLKTHFYWNLYKGLTFGVLTDVPFLASDDLKKPDGRYSQYNRGAQVENIMLHYTNSYLGIINTLSAGQFITNYIGWMDQAVYNYHNHTFKLKYAYFRNKEDKTIEKEVYLAKYSYLFDSLDMFAEIQAGQYFNRDRGFDFQLKRFFGDTAIMLRYQNTVPEIKTRYSDSANRDQYAGIAIELPLTPRKVGSYRYGQIRGTSNYYYYLRTTIRREDGSNTLNPAGGLEPVVPFEAQSYVLNRNRLNVSYMRHHMSRLIDAYEKFATKE